MTDQKLLLLQQQQAGEGAQGEDEAAAKRRKVLQEAADLDKDDSEDEEEEGDEEEGEGKKDKGKGKATSDDEEEDEESSDDDDDEDETAELLRELEKIKKERAEEKERQVRSLPDSSLGVLLMLSPCAGTRARGDGPDLARGGDRDRKVRFTVSSFPPPLRG